MAEKFPRLSFSENNILLNRVSLDEASKTRNPIILDTNFLFVTFEFKIDVISEIERIVSKEYSLFIFEGTLKELQAIEDKKDKNKKYLKLITTFLRIYKVSIIKSSESYVDKDILEAPKGFFVATNDKILREKLKANFVDVIYLRQKSYLEIN